MHIIPRITYKFSHFMVSIIAQPIPYKSEKKNNEGNQCVASLASPDTINDSSLNRTLIKQI